MINEQPNKIEMNNNNDDNDNNSSTNYYYNNALSLVITSYKIEFEGSSNQFVNYIIKYKSNSNLFSNNSVNHDDDNTVKRRYKDFKFLYMNLLKNFPASIIPPLPNQHRLEYLKGDRFSNEFIQTRLNELQLFLFRLSLHPLLNRSKVLIKFLTSSEWNSYVMSNANNNQLMESNDEKYFIDQLSDNFINIFIKLKKPNEEFVRICEELDKFNNNLIKLQTQFQKLKLKFFTTSSNSIDVDLIGDYDDQSSSVQSLAYLESGITEPLNRFSHIQLEYSNNLKNFSILSFDNNLNHINSLIKLTNNFKNLLKLRDQKQLDYEQLTTYHQQLSIQHHNLVSNKNDQLNLTNYLTSKIDQLRGTDDDKHKVEKIRKLENQMKQLELAVQTSSQHCNEFSEAVLREYSIFDMIKRIEMKDILSQLAKGHIASYKSTIEEFDKIIPHLQKIKVDV